MWNLVQPLCRATRPRIQYFTATAPKSRNTGLTKIFSVRTFAADAGTQPDKDPSVDHALQNSLRELVSLGKQGLEPNIQKFESLGDLRRELSTGKLNTRLELVRLLSQLGSLPGRPYSVGGHLLFFVEEYVGRLGPLRDGETIMDRASELRNILRWFHAAGVTAERLRQVYDHIAQDFPQFEQAGALLPMADAVNLCHTMLATGQSSAPAVIVLIRSALREPLMHVADDAQELRLLKMIEMLIRLDYLHTQEQLPEDVSEYLSVVRDIRYYDRELRRDTALSYQLAFFLRKHGFPSKRHMLGPYALKVCDLEERINFEPVSKRTFATGLPEDPPARQRRHLEAVGWRNFQVHEETWEKLETYEAKAAHVRNILKENDLIDI